jgi:hypothetical protein
MQVGDGEVATKAKVAMMGIGHPKRGDVMYVMSKEPRPVIVLTVEKHMYSCHYKVLVGMERWVVSCRSLHLTLEEAIKDFVDLGLGSSAIPEGTIADPRDLHILIHKEPNG